MDEFVGKVALITGAGRGVGRDLSLAFASLGARVAANDINPISLDETLSQVRAAGGNAWGFVFDVAKRMPIEGMIAQVLDHFGGIDILVNHASVDPAINLLDMDEWDFHRTMDVNLGGAYFCMQQVGRYMQAHGGGVMVNILSRPCHGDALKGHTAHFTSQAGLAGLTRSAARELSEFSIRVNAVWSGQAEEEVLHPPQWDKAVYQQWCRSLPMPPSGGYPGLVSLVLFLCSRSASSVNGQVIFTS